MAFLLIFIFLLVLAAIGDFFQYCDNMADTSDTFDIFLGPLAFFSDQCYQNTLDYYKNAIGSEEVNTRGQGLSMFLGVFLLYGGVASLGVITDFLFIH